MLRYGIHLEALGRYQLFLYITALLAGGSVSLLSSGGTTWLERLVWPTLTFLLYSTFSQVRLAGSLEAFKHGRFFTASLLANFTLVPGIVLGLSWLLPPDPAIKLGVFMVLLVPCTDWFVTFTHLARGDTKLAVAVVPVQLLAQFAFLTLYLWLFLGQEFTQVVATGPFVQAFAGLIVIPFALAWLTRQIAARFVQVTHWLRAIWKLPVPLLTLTLFLVAASQASLLRDVVGSLGWAALVFVLYLMIAALLARLMAKAFSLEVEAGRTLAFNLGTRNSFVVLPLALALPAGWEAAVAAIVLQSIVELSGVVALLWSVPRYLFPAALPTRRG